MMWWLENIPPAHKLSTTVKGLRLARVDHMAVMDITPLIQLAGQNLQGLNGEIPASFVNMGLANFVANVPAHLHVLPQNTRPGPGANAAINWAW